MSNKKKTEENKWFQAGAFEDGWQWGDLNTTVEATMADLRGNLISGLLEIGEGIVDTGAGIVGSIGGLYSRKFKEKVGKFVEKDLYDSDAIAKVIVNSTTPISWNRAAMMDESNSVLGEKADSLAQSTGQLLGTMALQSVGVPWWLTTGASTYGAEMQNAFQQGATYDQAMFSALVSAGAEILSEKLSGGISFGGKTLDDGLTNLLAANISSKTLQKVLKFATDATGEGLEEVFSNAISAIGQKLSYDKDKDVSFKQLFLSEEAFDNFIGGFVLGGGSNVIGNKAAKAEGKDAVTGLKTDTEKKVVDKIFNDTVAEKEKGGEKLSANQRTKLYGQIVDQLESGDIDVSDVESVLGEDVASEIDKNATEDEQKKQMSEKVFERVKGTKLMNSYVDAARRGESFQADVNEYDEAERATIQSAIDAGFLNNTNKTRRLVNWIAKISAKTGIKVDFTTNEKLKESGFSIDGKSINGYKTKDGIGLNMQSKKLMETVVGHEITHVLEGTKLYAEMQKAVYAYAEAKGELKSRREAISKLYNGVTKDIDSELTAELVGDYLFTDQEFINRLANDNRNLFQKIWDEVKYMWKQAHPSSPEAQKLEKLKRAFEEAYKASGEVKKTSGEMKFQLSGITEDGIEVYTTSKEVMDLTWKERKARYLDLMTNQYKGRTAKFVRNGHTYYAQFDEASLRKPIYGDERSSDKGRRAIIKAGADGDIFELVENSVYEGSSKNKKDHTAADYFDYFVKTVQIDGKVFDLVADVEKKYGVDGGYVYTLALKDNKTVKASPTNEHSQSEPFNSVGNAFTAPIISQNSDLSSGSAKNSAENNISVLEGGTKLSISDSNGKELTKGQQEFFIDSKVRDKNGNLKVMYHGTNESFTTFDKSKAKSSGTYGKGFYFTDSDSHASTYGKTYEVYLNIKNPLQNGTNDITKDQLRKFVEALAENEDYGIENYGYDATVDSVTDSVYGKSDFGMILDLNLSCVGNMVEAIELFNEVNGTDYDGIIAPTETVAFYPNQIKSVSNKNPTTNDDMQFSISEDPAKADADYLDAVNRGDTETAQRMVDESAKNNGYTIRAYHGTTEDFTTFSLENRGRNGEMLGVGYYFTDDKLEAIRYSKNTGKMKQVFLDIKKAISPKEMTITSQEWGEFLDFAQKHKDEYINSVWKGNDVDKAFEIKWMSDYDNDAQLIKTFIDTTSAGNATVAEGYMKMLKDSIGYDGVEYDNGDSKVYVVFTPEQIKSAKPVTYDGNGNVVPLSKRFNTENPDIRFSLSKEQATPREVYFSRIDEVYDKLKGMSAGKSHMVDGYNFFLQRNDYDESAYISITTPEGKKLRKIVDGGNLWKNARLWREAAKMVANNDYPNVATAKTQEEAGEYSEIEGKDEEINKTFKEKVAEGVSDTKNLGKKAVGYLVDKYQPIENLALKTGNRELDAKANTMRTSERAAQHFIGNGADGVRAINDLRQEVEASGLEKEFEEYMYDLLTTDRMSLEDRARPVIKKLGDKFKKLRVDQIKAIAKKPITDNTTDATAQTIRDAKEYLRAISTRNKPVRGDFYTADIARAHATELEQKYPQFKQWAEDVYANTNFMLDKLVADGELSQEAADRFRELYPHYVPIRRVNKEGKAVDVPLYSNRTGIDAPIKGATGGDGTIGYLFKTLAMRAEQTFLAGAKNRFGIELKNTLKAKTTDADVDVEDIFEEVDTHEDRLQAGEDGQAPTFTVFENGKRVTFEIPEDIYEALKPTPEPLKYTNRFLNAVTKFQRGVLTEYNPFFMLRNAAKDFQDVLINSQHAKETYKNFPEAMRQLYAYEHGSEDAQYAKEYFENGAEELTYFDGKEKLFNSKNVDDPWAKQKNSEAKKILGFIPSKISQASSFVERVPRLAEYIASRKAGASIDVAMLDAARVTTNFAAGGDVTKWANRNVATFLNASVQGAAQAVRNVREAKAQGLKGMLKLGAKVAIAGIPYLILNALLWGDDDEYEELSDYVKENYYIVAKYGDGQFVRIPKGRMAAVIQSAFDQMSNLVTGDDEVDFKRFGELLVENIAPNNPLENNIFAPIKNVIENKTWYRDDLVPQRLQDLPAGEQSDETTDAISKWLGETINVSPYKLNYLLDQYSGVFGDMFLPTITPQAEGGNSSILGGAIAPLADQFTTDSTMKNQNVSDFYDTLDDLTASAKSKYATDEDVLRYRYMNTINSEMSNLYKKKREIQNSDLPNSEKYEAVREVQRQIDDLAKEALASYNNMSVGRNSATVGGITYKKNSKGEWQKVSESSSKSYKLWSDETLNNFIQEYKLPKINWD